METRNLLYEYFKKLQKSINKKLEKSPKNYDKEDYHNLRVEIKKLKALMDFIKFNCADFKRKKLFKPFKKLFTQSGKVREFQLEKRIIEGYKQLFSLGKYFSKLNSRIQKEQKEFLKIMDKKMCREIRKSLKEIKSFAQKTESTDMEIYIKNENKKIHSLITQHPLEAEQMHSLRKLLKADFYNRKSIGITGNEACLQKVDNFLEVLGKWHDYRTTISHLEKFILKTNMDYIELGPLLKIKEEIFFDERSLFKKINTALKKLHVQPE